MLVLVITHAANATAEILATAQRLEAAAALLPRDTHRELADALTAFARETQRNARALLALSVEPAPAATFNPEGL